jgi:hypothetical protein
MIVIQHKRRDRETGDDLTQPLLRPPQGSFLPAVLPDLFLQGFDFFLQRFI